MRQCTGMGGLIGTIHHLLQIIQQAGCSQSSGFRKCLGQQSQGWQGCPLRCRPHPLTESGTGFLQKPLQLRIQSLGRGKRRQIRRRR